MTDKKTNNKAEVTHFNKKVWPFKPGLAIICMPLILIVLLITINITRTSLGWPDKTSDNIVLIGIFLFSLLPILLSLVDILVERGGAFEIKGIRFDFSKVEESASPEFVIPANIGMEGVAINITSVTMILDLLKKASASDFVIIDLKDGTAWWETRLLILLAGADRLKKPDKIVFLGMEKNKERQFLGWAYSSDLLNQLLQIDSYKKSYLAAKAAALQCALVEPLEVKESTKIAGLPTPFPLINGHLITQYFNMAFDLSTGLPNEMLPEQFLANYLGEKIESPEIKTPRRITRARLNELFDPVLFKNVIKQEWLTELQLYKFFENEYPFLVITSNGTYAAFVSRISIFNEMLKSISLNKKDK